MDFLKLIPNENINRKNKKIKLKSQVFCGIFTIICSFFLYNEFGVGLEFYIYINLLIMLEIISLIDYYTMEIHCAIIYVFSILNAILLLINNNLYIDNIMGALIGYFIYFFIYLISKKAYKKEVFGSGDVILLSSVGFIVGIKKCVIIAILSFYIAVLFFAIIYIVNKNKIKKYIPFAPFISISSIITIICYKYISLFIDKLIF